MFSSALRVRPIWHLVQPILQSSTRWRFTESNEVHYDLVVPLLFGSEMLHVEIVTTDELNECPTDVVPRRDDIHKRPEELLVLMNTSSGVGASYIGKAQTWQLKHHDNRPLILVSSPGELLAHLMLYIDNIDPISARPVLKKPSITSVIAVTTTASLHKPLTNDQATIVQHICHSIKGVEEALRTPQTRQKLLEYLDEPIVQNMSSFWNHES